MVKFYATSALKEKREALGTQKEMMAIICSDGKYNFDRTYYVHIETARAGIDAELALHIARILKTEVNEIFESKNE